MTGAVGAHERRGGLGDEEERREGGRTDVRKGLKEDRSDVASGEARRILALLRQRLDEAHGFGEPFLKLEPGDLTSLCSRAGIEGDAAGAFRLLVRSNLVRLRGRWREGVSGETAPVYVSRVVEGDGTGRAAGFGGDGAGEVRRKEAGRNEQ